MPNKPERQRRPGGAGLGRRARQGLPAKLQLHVTVEEKYDIERAASVLGISASRFASRAALRDAELVLAGQELRASGERLRPTHVRVLQLIASRPKTRPASMGWVSQQLQISLPVLSREIRHMQKLQLVIRRRVKGHRGVFLYLAERGRRIWQRARAAD
jgi:DNA-binding MarR family transcriptional regulator